MKVMILAAGRGERMKPLTDHCPKPLLKVADIPLIEHHIRRLAAAGFREIVINHAWLGQQIVDYLGNGERWQVNIQYSDESSGALETAGGIAKALPLLTERQGEDSVFGIVNGDVFTDFDFSQWHQDTQCLSIDNSKQGCLYLVTNPEHNKEGDFALNQGIVEPLTENTKSLTYSGLALFKTSFFEQAPASANQNASDAVGEEKKQQQKLALGPMLKTAASQQQLVGKHYQGLWTDVGTPERLSQLEHVLNKTKVK